MPDHEHVGRAAPQGGGGADPLLALLADGERRPLVGHVAEADLAHQGQIPIVDRDVHALPVLQPGDNRGERGIPGQGRQRRNRHGQDREPQPGTRHDAWASKSRFSAVTRPTHGNSSFPAQSGLKCNSYVPIQFLAGILEWYTGNFDECQIISDRRRRVVFSWRSELSNTALIVDDAEFMRVMLREILEDMGLTIAGEASNGVEAIEQYGQLHPDPVLLDITMPTMDGNEALGEILRENPQALVVMITALGQKEQVLTAIKAGARDFIIKPFDQERVQDTIARLLPGCPVA